MSEPRFSHQECNEAVEHWLHEEVAPAYDAMQADPDRALDRKSVV